MRNTMFEVNKEMQVKLSKNNLLKSLALEKIDEGRSAKHSSQMSGELSSALVKHQSSLK